MNESLSARIDLDKYGESLKEAKNFILQPQGGAYRRPGLKFIAEPNADAIPTTPGQPTIIPFIYNSETAYVIALQNNAFSVYNEDSFVTADVSFLTTEENKTADYAQSADTLYLVHRNKTPIKIVRTSPTVFDAQLLNIGASLPTPTNFTGSFTGGAGTVEILYAVTAISDDGEESLAALYTITNGKAPLQWTSNNKSTLNWTAVTGADAYNLYKVRQGLYGYIGTARGVETFIDYNYDPLINDSIPQTYDPFATENPGVVALFQQRLWFANTLSKPQTIFASRVGDFENFNFSFIIRQDDSIENIIYSGRVDGVRWIIPFNKTLKVGTQEKQWEIFATSGGAITPTDINIEPELEWGAAKIKPVLAGNSLIYVEDKGSKIFDVFDSQQYRGFTGNNRSINSTDLFEDFEIVSMAYQRTPDPVIWCVRDDGKVVALTYLLNESMWGWHRHETDGFFRSVSVIPGSVNDEVYFIVERVIESVTRYYLEKLEEKFNGILEDAKFLDAMITKTNGTPFTTVEGLDHLEGKVVNALANGVVYEGLSVISGQTTIPVETTKVHVGLPYDSILAPLSVEYATQNQGLSLGRIKSISDATIRFKNSKGGKIGPGLGYLDDLKTSEYPPTDGVFTGDVRVTAPSKADTDASFYVVQDEPLPMDIRALMMNVEMGI